MNIIDYLGELKPIKPLIPLNLNMVKYLILHHPDAVTASPQEINQWHKENGWNCGGYNEYIRKNGVTYIMRGDHIGAQCLNFNSVSYGICLEGNYNIEKEMPDAQLKTVIERIKYHKNRMPYNVSIDIHSKFTDTTCAGQFFPFQKIIEGVNQMDNEIKQSQTLDEEFKANLEFLKSYNDINTPQYWLDHCVEGGKIDGLYAKAILNKFAELRKSQPL